MRQGEPSIGRKLREFMSDEAIISENAFFELRQELPFFDSLMELYLDLLNREDALRNGESKYYALCSLSRTQTIKACTNMLRAHVADGFAASRIAADAALYALMMSTGRLSEADYLAESRAKNDALRKLGADIRNGVEIPSIILAVHQVRALHSPHAHADPISLSNRIIKNIDGTIRYSHFQELDESLDLRYFFMGFLWVGGMCLRAFLDIQHREFGEDVSTLTASLDQWKSALTDHRRSSGIFPERSDTDGF